MTASRWIPLPAAERAVDEAVSPEGHFLRRLGAVKDRLRWKDATHAIANIAVPSTIRLVAEVRDRLLAAWPPWAAARGAEEFARADAIRLGTDDAKDAVRLRQVDRRGGLYRSRVKLMPVPTSPQRKQGVELPPLLALRACEKTSN